MLLRIIGSFLAVTGLAIQITFIVMGFLQFFAIMDGFEIWLGLHWIIAAPLALITAYIPIAGTIFGMCGAVYAWDWSLVSVFLLFCGPFIVVFTIAGIATLLESSR